MSLTDAEFRTIMADETKRIPGDITWSRMEGRSATSVFHVAVLSDRGWPLFIQGRYNSPNESLTFTLILRTTGRIYGLDLGQNHHNPQCSHVGTRHRHRWSERYRDKEAFVPDDITAPASDPVAVWREFCAGARIRHDGSMSPPPKAWPR